VMGALGGLREILKGGGALGTGGSEPQRTLGAGPIDPKNPKKE